MIKKACLPAPPDCTEYGLLSDFYKRDDNSRVWWIEALEKKGPLLFSFDGKKIYNYWQDYPCNLTPEEVKIFQEDEPYWANFRRASTAGACARQHDGRRVQYDDGHRIQAGS